MILQIALTLLLCSNWVFTEDRSDEQLTDEKWQIFNAWLRIEVMVFFSYIAANMVWLFVRSLFRNTVDFIAGNPSVNERTDYLESNLILMCVVESFVSPALVSLAILTMPNKFVFGQSMTFMPESLVYIKLFFTITFLQSFFSFFMNFVFFYVYKGSERRNKYMVYVHYILIIVTLLVIPPMIAILYAVFLFTVDIDIVTNRVVNSWLLMNTINSLCMIWYYFRVFRDVIDNVYYAWTTNMEFD